MSAAADSGAYFIRAHLVGSKVLLSIREAVRPWNRAGDGWARCGRGWGGEKMRVQIFWGKGSSFPAEFESQAWP